MLEGANTILHRRNEELQQSCDALLRERIETGPLVHSSGGGDEGGFQGENDAQLLLSIRANSSKNTEPATQNR